jgi:hypothetical protein
VRQFAFAGIAIVWIFKIDKPKDHLIPAELFIPLLFLVVALAFDFLQNLIGAFIWFLFYRHHEKLGHGEEFDTKANGWVTVPIWCFFGLKIIMLMIAYYFIVLNIIGRL